MSSASVPWSFQVQLVGTVVSALTALGRLLLVVVCLELAPMKTDGNPVGPPLVAVLPIWVVILKR